MRTLTILALVLSGTSLFSQPVVGFTILPEQNGTEVTADVMVYDFNDIVSMQFSISWDPTKLEFQSVGDLSLPDLNASNFGLNLVNEGTLTYSWIDILTQGVTMPDCSPIFTIHFQSIGTDIPPIEIVEDPTAYEIVNADLELLDFIQTPFCGNAGTIQGNVYFDLNDNCLFDLGETDLEGWIVQIDGNGSTSYATTKPDGSYSKLLLPGSYDVSIVLPENDLWAACSSPQTITLDTFATETIDFPMQASLSCPSLSVDFSAPFLRRCFESNYYVKYCNKGTATASGAYVEIEIDPYLEVTGSTILWSSANGNVYSFPVGDVGVGDCGFFQVTVMVDCDAVLGQTHCSTAHIFPDDPCTPTDPLWDGSDLEVSGSCDGDSVRFEIKNLGDDMAEPLEFIVIEDDMIYLMSNPIQLLSQETATVAVEANGSTWRVEMPQSDNHPFGSFTTEAIEGCGTNGSGSFSLGFVTQFPEDEENPAIDEDCQENVGSFDPNDKTGYPKGFCAGHYIRAGQDIEYKIRFQNTGTDTAFNLVVTDTLSPFIDPASIRPGASSHAYDFELTGEGVLTFTFANAMLPDSTTNLDASQGFVKFTVSQKNNLPMGTVINNQAAIVFDFNEPVLTNTYSHTIGDDFVEMAGQSGNLSVSGYVNTWYGEPVENVAMTMTNLCPVFTDPYGYFLFENIDTANYTLTAAKENDNPREGVTVLDIVKLRNFILGIQLFDNPYQSIAADVNHSGTLSTFDLVVFRKLILGLPTDNVDWRFFPVTNQAYAYTPLETSLDGQDFVAVKPGNIIEESMVETSTINTAFFFEPEQLTSNQLRVDVKANDFTSVNGFQFGLKWDASVIQFSAIDPGFITTAASSWTHSPAPGQLNLVYLTGADSLTASSDEVLFTLVFNVLAPVNSTTQIELDETNIPLQVVVELCKLAGASVTSTEVTIADPNAVIDFEKIGLQLTLHPNPLQVGQDLNVKIQTTSAQQLTVEFIDLGGKQHYLETLDCPAGQSSYLLHPKLAKGIYFVKIAAGSGAVKSTKLVVY